MDSLQPPIMSFCFFLFSFGRRARVLKCSMSQLMLLMYSIRFEVRTKHQKHKIYDSLQIHRDSKEKKHYDFGFEQNERLFQRWSDQNTLHYRWVNFKLQRHKRLLKYSHQTHILKRKSLVLQMNNVCIDNLIKENL